MEVTTKHLLYHNKVGDREEEGPRLDVDKQKTEYGKRRGRICGCALSGRSKEEEGETKRVCSGSCKKKKTVDRGVKLKA